MESGPLSDARFAEFGKHVVLFCHITSRVDGDPYHDLLQAKGGRGFPYLVFMDASGEVIARPRERTVEAFVKTRAACERLPALEGKARTGDKSVAADLLIARIEMGMISFEEARAAEAALAEVPAKKREQLRDLLVELEVDDAISQIRTRAQAVEAGKRFAAMWGQDSVPKDRNAPMFFAIIMEAAAADEDAKLYERALAEYEKVAPAGRGRERHLESMRRRLAELKRK